MFKSVSSRINFPELEKKLLKKWYGNGTIYKYLHRNDNSLDKFVFLDGPITANNPMGVHHAWGRTYKDFFQRFWNMRGKKQRFQNGFDEQGLWVEVEVEKELGLKNKKDIENLVPGNKFKSLEKFINLCKERVRKFSKIQTEQSKRLGYFMDWENSYHTSSDKNNYAIWNFIKIVHKKGWLYKGHDTVPWCPRCGTAISQHEILTEEYQEIVHTSVYFKLPIQGRRNEYLLVWTTTPWTVPGNVAVAINPKIKYVKVEFEGKIYYLAKSRLKVFQKGALISTDIKAKDLLGLNYSAPFDDFSRVKKQLGRFRHKVIDGGELVTDDEGTGILHVAPGQGEEDFKLGLEQKLPVIELISEDSTYMDGMREFSGKNAKNNPDLIINYLKIKDGGNFFVRTEKYKHRYPTCWRCRTELVWRVVDEWYIAMDKKDDSGKTYREQMIEVAKKITWMPDWGLERELDWLRNMHDWLISKKRYWGLALPIWECDSCGKFEVIGGKEELKNKSVFGFDKFEGNSPHRPWIDQVKIKCSSCEKIISRIPDVGNPWLDAGIVPFSTLPKDWFPADFITESFPGQFKNWFYALIAMSTVLANREPFKRVLGYGSVRDEKGEEMHKSKGNAIEFNEAADKIGVDVMRWLYLRTNPEHNVNFGYHVTDEIRRFFHLRLWNAYSFFVMYANVYRWTPKTLLRPKHVLDRWILSRMHGSIKHITFGSNGNKSEGIENYNVFDAASSAEIFVINDLSNWYIRRIRDRVNPTAEDIDDKNDAYQTLWTVLTTYSKVLAPFIPFISDEIYTNLTGEDSVHLSNWPEVDETLRDERLEDKMDMIRKIVELGHAKRKEKKIKVRQPLEKFKISNLKFKISDELVNLIKDELNVKDVIQTVGEGEIFVDFDFRISDRLRKEGEAREIIRRIQEGRKKLGTRFDEKVDIEIDYWPSEFEEYIKKNALVDEIRKGKVFLVIRK